MGIGKVGVACRGSVPPVSKQLADQRQIFARHDGLTGRRMPKVMQAKPPELCILADRARPEFRVGKMDALAVHAMAGAGEKGTIGASGVHRTRRGFAGPAGGIQSPSRGTRNAVAAPTMPPGRRAVAGEPLRS